jgi:hypothetical protein
MRREHPINEKKSPTILKRAQFCEKSLIILKKSPINEKKGPNL